MNCFHYCEKLSSIRISGNITRIEHNTFDCCFELKTVTLSDNIQSFGYPVFRQCSSLRSISLPKNIISIGEDSFLECTNLRTIGYYYLGNYGPSYEGDVIFNNSVINVIYVTPDYQGTSFCGLPASYYQTDYFSSSSVFSFTNQFTKSYQL